MRVNEMSDQRDCSMKQPMVVIRITSDSGVCLSLVSRVSAEADWPLACRFEEAQFDRLAFTADSHR